MAASSASALFLIKPASSSLRSSCSRYPMPACAFTSSSPAPSASSLSLHSSCNPATIFNSIPPNHNKRHRFFPSIKCGVVKPCTTPADHLENETMKLARKAFYDEISFRRRDDNISLAKAALLICVEDEAYLLANRERDLAALQKEGRVTLKPFATDPGVPEGQSIAFWLEKLDSFSETIEKSLDSSSPHQPLEIFNQFTRKSSLTTDPKNFYLHQVLSRGAGTAIMLGILYIEVCRRLGVEVKGAPVGDDFFVWPSTETKVDRGGAPLECGLSPEMVFEPFKGGKIWSRNCDGSYVKQRQQQPVDSSSSAAAAAAAPLTGPYPTKNLHPVSNRAMLSVLLRNLKRLYWKRAAKALTGSEIASSVHLALPGLLNPQEQALLRPQDLRLAVAASEKLLLLKPHDWLTRRDHGILLYHCRRYGEAVQELSICMAVAPVHEVQVLEPFVEKLHLLRVESSWAASFTPNTPSALA